MNAQKRNLLVLKLRRAGILLLCFLSAGGAVLAQTRVTGKITGVTAWWEVFSAKSSS